MGTKLVYVIGFVFCLCYLQTEARVYKQPPPDEATNDASCFLGGVWVEGLQADTNTFDPHSCERLWWCRPNGNETGSFSYDCMDLNNGSKPYFDVSTGECVDYNSHCPDHFNNYISPNTAREYKPSGVNETCRGWGVDETYYMEIFPNLDNSSLYWQCVPNYTETEGDLVLRTIAVSRSCVSNLVFSSQNNCSCDYPGDVNNTRAIQAFNQHPANRFKCATLLNETSVETCHDEDRRFYEGKIPSNSSRRSYWKCVRQGETLVSKPEFQTCHVGQVFNVTTCSCSPADDYFDDQSSNENTDRFKCAKLIEDCGSGDDPVCHDEAGRYYLGVIPHTKECSKYYMCDWNPTPGGSPPVLPKPQQCPRGLIFNVNSSFCGCDYPENSRCFANSDDKFKCASLAPAYTKKSP